MTHIQTIRTQSQHSLPHMHDKRDDFDFEIVNFPFLDGDVPRSTSYGVSFVLLKHLAMLLTSTLAINC